MRIDSRSLTLVALLAGCGGKTTDSDTPADGSVIDASSDGAGVDTSHVDTAPSIDGTPVVDGGGDDPTACDGPGDCVVVPRTCCGFCGVASATDMIAVEPARASSYRSSVCGPGTGCPDCAGRVDSFLQGFCVAGHCKAVDLHGDPMTGCATDGDCQLRYAACCEPCGAPADGLVALRTDAVGTYRTLVCAPDAACPKCATSYPPAAKAVCDATTKHCTVTGLGPP